jgi:hypothetical protein
MNANSSIDKTNNEAVWFILLKRRMRYEIKNRMVEIIMAIPSSTMPVNSVFTGTMLRAKKTIFSVIRATSKNSGIDRVER